MIRHRSSLRAIRGTRYVRDAPDGVGAPRPRLSSALRRAVRTRRRSNAESLRNAGVACIVGALITTVGGVATQIARASTDVSDQAWSYPWSPGTFVVLSMLWASPTY